MSSGKLTSAQATELQGVFKAAFANGAGGPGMAAVQMPQALPAVRARPRLRLPPAPRTMAITATMAVRRRHFVIDQQHERLIEHQLGWRHSAAVSAIAAEFAVGLVVVILQRDRHSDTGNASNGSSSFSALLIDYQT